MRKEIKDQKRRVQKRGEKKSKEREEQGEGRGRESGCTNTL